MHEDRVIVSVPSGRPLLWVQKDLREALITLGTNLDVGAINGEAMWTSSNRGRLEWKIGGHGTIIGRFSYSAARHRISLVLSFPASFSEDQVEKSLRMLRDEVENTCRTNRAVSPPVPIG